jgi:hypothetical protein
MTLAMGNGEAHTMDSAKKDYSKSATCVEKKRISVLLPKELHRRLRISAINADKLLSDYVMEMIEKDVEMNHPTVKEL